MKVNTTEINGVSLIELSSFQDERGSFTRWYCEEVLKDILGGRKVVQANHSTTASVGAIRGLHFQHAPYAETKLIRCIRGAVFDVVVDLRANSETYLQVFSVELREGDDRLLKVPEGCAHGFQVLECDSELLYLHTQPYAPAFEGGLRYNDPAVAIEWPLAVVDVSDRDLNHPLIDDQFSGVST